MENRETGSCSIAVCSNAYYLGDLQCGLLKVINFSTSYHRPPCEEIRYADSQGAPALAGGGLFFYRFAVTLTQQYIITIPPSFAFLIKIRFNYLAACLWRISPIRHMLYLCRIYIIL